MKNWHRKSQEIRIEIIFISDAPNQSLPTVKESTFDGLISQQY